MDKNERDAIAKFCSSLATVKTNLSAILPDQTIETMQMVLSKVKSDKQKECAEIDDELSSENNNVRQTIEYIDLADSALFEFRIKSTKLIALMDEIQFYLTEVGA